MFTVYLHACVCLCAPLSSLLVWRGWLQRRVKTHTLVCTCTCPRIRTYPCTVYAPPREPRKGREERRNKASKICFNPDLMTGSPVIMRSEVHTHMHTHVRLWLTQGGNNTEACLKFTSLFPSKGGRLSSYAEQPCAQQIIVLNVIKKNHSV